MKLLLKLNLIFKVKDAALRRLFIILPLKTVALPI